MSAKARPNPQSDQAKIEILLTVAEIAARHKTGREQVHRWIRAGDLEVLRVGRLVRVRPDALAEFERRHIIPARGVR